MLLQDGAEPRGVKRLRGAARAPAALRDEPVHAADLGRLTRRVQLVREEGRDASS